MKGKQVMRTLSVTIPNHEYRIQVAKKSRKTGKPRYWTINGQGLYNASLHYTTRSRVTKYFHKKLSKEIQKQISPLDIFFINAYVYPLSIYKLTISVDIYEQKRGKMPDIRNMWLWGKWFEDALQECGVIPDDSPDYVIESGPTRYYFVEEERERKLIFNIGFINLNN